ncbi:heterokaryon incompatibility protein-domain-containing protein [Paraphoma chrysanthemicola]|uniref:Heterokaryon incompatibility protein-domain-containing protein n=1 Tax=Paraphoma chrysanthemicola TaxID=798071 RepID=A0A8K0VWW8_9PLEO|nr:heterokaryon incompatibility protein-domain-containing protein [Paraphoma chrysanthemicola]
MDSLGISPEPQHESASFYEALSSARQEIRVLDITPSAAADEVLQCTMRTICLLDEPVPTYETISYCWGKPTAPSYIRLNGSLVPVTASSEAAIRRMRLPEEMRTLWIDAVCIDQSSLAERSQQVSLMSTVYRKGKHNLIYLGEDTEGLAERAVRSIQDLIYEMKKVTKDFSLLSETLYDPLTCGVQFTKEDFLVEVDFEALECLFNLQWFSRLWVLQEVTLAPSSTCHWGAFRFDLTDTIRAACWLSHKSRFVPRGLQDSKGKACAAVMFDCSLGTLPWQYMMGTAKLFEKNEPKDSIFAMLGLNDSGDERDDTRRANLLRVDYTRPLGDVLRDATRYGLCQSGDLSAMRFINHRSPTLDDEQGFPTWTIRADLEHDSQDIAILPEFFHACSDLGPSSMLTEVVSDADVLVVEGFVVDRVLETTATYDDVTFGYKGYNAWLLSAKQKAQRRPQFKKSEEALVDHTAVALTLVAESTFMRRARPEDVSVLATYLENLVVRNDNSVPEHILSSGNCDAAKLDEVYASSFVDYCIERRFFTTSAGRMGIGPRVMRSTDLVVILRGGSTPFILRERNESYQLLGGAYVHGIMDGEAVRTAENQGLQEDIFHIR